MRRAGLSASAELLVTNENKNSGKSFETRQSCLFGLVVECANARLSTRPGLISWT